MSHITKAMVAEAESRGFERGQALGYRKGWDESKAASRRELEEERAIAQRLNALGQAICANSQAIEAMARLLGKGF